MRFVVTNDYCEKHEWPAGWGKPCPDCAELVTVVEAERERCAKIAEGQKAYCYNDQTEECHGGHCDMAMAEAIARLIRECK